MAKNFLKALCFLLVLLMLLIGCSKVLMPKWTTGTSPATLQMQGFYDEPKNSIDVLFLGSCNIYNAFNPLILWEKYGATSYVLASSDQALSTSYYYLKEALQYQTPKIVVLETLMFTYYEGWDKEDYTYEPNENYHRRSIDYMRLSLNKLGIINTFISEENCWRRENNQEILSPLFHYAENLLPVFRYHNRWKELAEEDFSYWQTDTNHSTRGSVPVFTYPSFANLKTHNFMAKNGSQAIIKDDTLQNFNKIKSLCDDNNITLLLVKSPTMYFWNYEHHQVLSDLAKSNNLTFVDFNTQMTPNAYFHYDSNFFRLNAYGMQNFSDALSDYIHEHYSIPVRTDDHTIVNRWNQGVAQYNEVLIQAQTTDDLWKKMRILEPRQ